MLDTLRLADGLILGGMAKGQRIPIELGRDYFNMKTRDIVRYISPHTRPGHWDWSGKVNVWLREKHRMGVCRPSDLMRPPKQTGGAA